MDWHNVVEISKDVYWVGVKDWDRRLFDALIPLPHGTTYNSYLVKGSNQTALIDTVNPGFEQELKAKIGEVTKPESVDYVIMNHAEPDHANAVSYLAGMFPDAKLITTKKGADMAKAFFKISDDRIQTVKEGDMIDLGGKTLRFIEAPWLHWPETMFTYLEEDRVLFPCDFLGMHTTVGFYDDELEDMIPVAKRYFGEIMMPFRSMGRKAMDKIRKLDIRMIAPSHGPIHRNPQRIMDAYDRWTAGETEEKAIIVYASMWGATNAMIRVMADTLTGEGIDVRLYDLSRSDIGDIAMDLVDSRAIVLGTPTLLGGMHPLAVYASYLVKVLRPPLKYGAVISSYGWAGGALKHAGEMLGPTKIEIVGALEIHGRPDESDLSKVVDIGRQLADRIKSSGKGGAATAGAARTA